MASTKQIFSQLSIISALTQQHLALFWTEYNQTKMFNYNMGHVLCIISEIEESSMMKKGSPRTASALVLLAVKNT